MMTLNYSQVSYFNLTAYFDTGMFKYFCFLILLCLYVLIVVSNVFLIMVIWFNRSLHEPMYLFLCSLFVNELMGGTGLFPFLMDQVLTDVHTVSASLCFLQIFCLYSYTTVEFLTLTSMSYDRYLAICWPLQYHSRMTHTKVFLFITLLWFYPFISIFTLISLNAPLQRCGNIIDKVYCDNYSIVKLSCSDTTVNNAYGLIVTVLLIFFPLCFIFYTYMRILQVCFSGSKQTRHKAISTCTPHLASLLNFASGCCFEVIQNRFNMSNVPNVLRIVLSLYFFTCQPIFTPVVYGLKLSKIRLVCRNLFGSNA